MYYQNFRSLSQPLDKSQIFREYAATEICAGGTRTVEQLPLQYP